MNQEKYIGMDVHQATISVAVMDSSGKLIMECILETKAATILEFLDGLRGSLSVTFEEGTSAAWLHDLLKPHVSCLVVCDPRKNALLKDGSKSDRIDARKLAELLRGNQLHPVYHGEHGVRTLKELGRSYQTLTQDGTRVMTRIKALYRSWAIPCSGATVYAPRHRAEWLAKIPQPGVRRRAERLYQQLDLLQPVRQEARRDLLSESRKHPAVKLLRQIPIYSEPAQAHLQLRDELRKIVGNRDWCISFRWGGDLNECACVLAASAGLVRVCDAVAYYPDDDLNYELNRLLEDFRACF